MGDDGDFELSGLGLGLGFWYVLRERYSYGESSGQALMWGHGQY